MEEKKKLKFYKRVYIIKDNYLLYDLKAIYSVQYVCAIFLNTLHKKITFTFFKLKIYGE